MTDSLGFFLAWFSLAWFSMGFPAGFIFALWFTGSSAMTRLDNIAAQLREAHIARHQPYRLPVEPWDELPEEKKAKWRFLTRQAADLLGVGLSK